MNLDRINELANKEKAEGLTAAEKEEQAKLRAEYIETFRKGFSDQIEAIKIFDAEGNELTSEKVKKIQQEKKENQES